MPEIKYHESMQQAHPDFFKKATDVFKKIPDFMSGKIPPDPTKECQLYLSEGCAHVDGMLCDYPNCDMNDKYCKENGYKSPKSPQP